MASESLARRLGEFHPFHATAREEIADLVSSRAILRLEELASDRGEVESSSPFLVQTAAPVDDEDLAPVQHILLHGPAGSGKRSLANALSVALRGRTEVTVVESDTAPKVDRGIVVWVSRDGRVPKGMPSRTPRIRVRSLSSVEKLRLVQIQVDSTCRSYGLVSHDFLKSELLDMLLRGGLSEAGVLGAVQRLHRLCRRLSRQRAEGNHVPVDTAWAASVLGAEAHSLDPLPPRLNPGAVFAPIVSSLGGAISMIEAFATPGRGKLTLTGAGPQSEIAAQVARSRCLALAPQLRFPVDTLRDMDWHVHVSGPDGPKDGLSLGWPVVVAMASHLSGVAVDARFAFTGEISLSGELRTVGYIDEKFLACEREGFRRVYMPSRNLPELADLGPEAIGSCEPTPTPGDLAVLRHLGLVSGRA